MSRYRKRPVPVSAWRAPLFDEPDYPGRFPPWLDEAVESGTVTVRMSPPRGVEFDVRTLEGAMRANVGDWLIRGVAGEIYPCKPDIFARTYERVDAGTPDDTPGLGAEDLIRAAVAMIERSEHPYHFAVTGSPLESTVLCTGALMIPRAEREPFMDAWTAASLAIARTHGIEQLVREARLSS